MTITTITFNNTPIQSITRNNQIWISSSELAKALQYKSEKSVTNIFNANSDEFTDQMSLVIKSVTNGINNSLREKSVRIFSLRGCHLIAMFSRTKIAKEFRKWVLNILDKELGINQQKSTPDDRTGLRDAVNLLVSKKKMLYPDAYSLVHQYMNVNSIDEIPKDELKTAIEYCHRLILTGEVIDAPKEYTVKIPGEGRWLVNIDSDVGEPRIKSINDKSFFDKDLFVQLSRETRLVSMLTQELSKRLRVAYGEESESLFDTPILQLIR